MRRRIVIAPDSLKGSLSALDAALAIAAGWRAERPDDELVLAPQADGGEGTLDAIAEAVLGAQWRNARVTGPNGETRAARWLLLPGDHAVIELAECCGITLLPRATDGSPSHAPMTASSRGAGEAIGAALDAGAQHITLALGGSASTDGGLGALTALGLRLLDADGCTLEPGGGALTRLTEIDASGLRASPPRGMTLLADTTAVLCGSRGAPAVFGPQKGASPEQVALLDRGLACAAAVAGGDAHLEPGTGAAGGTAWGFARYWGASIRSGAEAIAELTNLDEALKGADLVITGEGRLDETSRTGKVVGALATRATAAGVSVAVVAGQADLACDAADTSPAPTLGRGLGILLTLADLAGSTAAAMREPEQWLRAAGAELARRTTRDSE